MSMSTNTTKINVKQNRRPGGMSDYWMEEILRSVDMEPEQEDESEQQPSPEIVSGQRQVGIND